MIRLGLSLATTAIRNVISGAVAAFVPSYKFNDARNSMYTSTVVL